MSSSPSSEEVMTASATPGDQLLAEGASSREASPAESSSAPASPSGAQPPNPSNDAAPVAPDPTTEHGPDNTVVSVSSESEVVSTGAPGDATAEASHEQGDGNTGGQTAPPQTQVSTDGRIRNPIPAKLQDSATEKEGTFAVTQMAREEPAMDARTLAAKRSSEMTQAAAMQAARDGYRPYFKRPSRPSWNVSSQAQQPQHPPQTTGKATYHGPPAHPGHQHAPAPMYYPPPPPVQMHQSLNPQGVKSEQARLLTFLRSIHPIIVVDQLCKAMAYFGGIPGGPAPQDNVFPYSDKMNGSGAHFIGWMSEIFPPADFTKPPFSSMPQLPPAITTPHNQGQPAHPPTGGPNGQNSLPAPAPEQQQQPQAGQLEQPQSHYSRRGDPNTPRRPRGRPKGSKSSKARKDKGIKKGPMPGAAGSTEASAIDLDENDDAQGQGEDGQPTAAVSLTMPASTETPSGRRRGRPKGSKNKARPLSWEQTRGANIFSPRTTQDKAAPTNGPVPGAGAPADQTPNVPRPSPLSSQTELGTTAARPADGLSQHAENWGDPPAQQPAQPSAASSQRDDDQSGGKRKAAGQEGESGQSPSWTNRQGQAEGTPQQQHVSPVVPNKRPRLSQDGRQPGTATPAENANTLARAASTAQEAVPGSSRATGSNSNTTSPRAARVPVPSAQPQPQQVQIPQAQQVQPPQQQVQGHASPNMAYYAAGNSASPPHSAQQQPHQNVQQRPVQHNQTLSNERQELTQQRAQQYQQAQAHAQKQLQAKKQMQAQAQAQGQYAQQKTAQPAQQSHSSPASTPTEITRQNSSTPVGSVTTATAFSTSYPNDSTYMAIEYAMSANRAVEQRQSTYHGQSSQPQMDISLTEAEIRDRLYKAFGGRR